MGPYAFSSEVFEDPLSNPDFYFTAGTALLTVSCGIYSFEIFAEISAVMVCRSFGITHKVFEEAVAKKSLSRLRVGEFTNMFYNSFISNLPKTKPFFQEDISLHEKSLALLKGANVLMSPFVGIILTTGVPLFAIVATFLTTYDKSSKNCQIKLVMCAWISLPVMAVVEVIIISSCVNYEEYILIPRAIMAPR